MPSSAQPITINHNPRRVQVAATTAAKLTITIAALALTACNTNNTTNTVNHHETARTPSHTNRPAVIAHRGASGHLPEHTLAAYAAAYFMNADYIEPDLVMTADGHLICSHDIELEKTTNANTIFPQRASSNNTWQATDFTLAEVKQLSRTGRPNTGSPSGTHPWSGHTIPTFDEAAQLVLRLNASTNRTVGLIPEIKEPKAHQAKGLDPSAALIAALANLGLDQPDSPVWIQCFDHDELRRIRNQLNFKGKLVALTSSTPLTNEELTDIATFANAIGPSRKAIENDAGQPIEHPTLIQRAHVKGLAVFPYTFKDEPQATHRFFNTHQVDGLFTDYPQVGVRARE